ncbi:MAG: HD domain-containing protein [Sulfolobaceae archaeon]|nr:HD domain-containing protein [Sulfolobaceae archaeon]
MKKIYDEIHGYIVLNDLEQRIVDTPLFQRLRRIKQTSLAFLVYPGAVHTRFSHSLGTFHLAMKLGNLFVSKGIITDEELEAIKLAALIHDIGQFPFSHSLEGFYIDRNLSNEELRNFILTSSTEIKDILSENGSLYSRILELLRPLGSTLSLIIDSDIDVDRMDYLIRDSRHTGVTLGNIDLDRILDTISYTNEGILISEKGLHSIESFYISRLHMYQAVYYHKTILGYELMLRRIFKDLIEYCCPEFEQPEHLKELIKEDLFSYWDDDWVIGRLYYALMSPDAPDKLKIKIKRFLDRKGPKVVFNFLSYNDQKPQIDIEEYVNKLEKAGIPENSIYAVEEKIPIINPDKIYILTKNDEEIPLKQYKFTLLNSIPQSIIIKRIYVDPEFELRAKEVL